MSQYIRWPSNGSGGGISTYATAGDLPASATDGSAAITLDTDTLYIYNDGTATWLPVASPGSVLSIGTLGSVAPSANGAVISSNALILQLASATVPGLVGTGAQTFAGNKTFTGSISASNLSGTNTGDITLTAVGSSPSANGASLSGQALTLQPADATHPGVLTAADWNTFNNKQPAGNYITALTGDATASGPGSAALTLATVNSNVGSFGSTSQSLTITVNAKGLVTAAAAQSIQIAESQVTNLVSDLAGKQPTGNYITDLSGDVVATGPGAVSATIQAGVVSNSKLANMVNNTVKGNTSGSTGAPSDLVLSDLSETGSSVLTIANGSKAVVASASLTIKLNLANGAIYIGNASGVPVANVPTGDVTISNTGVTAIGSNKVTDAMLRQSSGLSLIGRSANTTGNVADITAASDNQILRRSGTSIGFGSIDLSQSNAVGSSILTVPNGGTGVASTTAYAVLCGGTTSTGALQSIASVGTSGQFLKSNGAGALPSFADVTATPAYSVTSKSGTYTATNSDNVILVDDSGGSWTLTLPTAVGITGHIYVIKKTNSGLSTAVTIATTSSQTIDGNAGGSYKLNTLNETYTIVSDGSNWKITDHKTSTPWTSYTPTFSAGYGTVSSNVARWRRVGDTIEVLGSVVAGTTAASLASFTLPSGLSLDTNKLSLNNNSSNPGNIIGEMRGNGANNVFSVVTAPATDATVVYMSGLITNGGGAANSPKNGNSTLSGSEALSYRYSAPISGWNE